MAIDPNVLEPKGKHDAASSRHQDTRDSKTQCLFERVQNKDLQSLHLSGGVQVMAFETPVSKEATQRKRSCRVVGAQAKGTKQSDCR